MPRRPALLSTSALVVALTLGACGSDGPDGGEAAEVTTPPAAERTTTTLSVEEEVERAYLRSWDVYAKAVRDLDPMGLEQAYAGDALETVRAEVMRLKAAGTPIVVKIEHDLDVQLVSPDEAVVVDQYVNRNYRTTLAGEPIDDPNKAGTYVESYQLKRAGREWSVVRIVRQS